MANIIINQEFEPIASKLRKTSNDQTKEFTQNYSNSTQILSRKSSIDNTSFFEEEKSDIDSHISNNTSCFDSCSDEDIQERWDLSSICTDNSNQRQKRASNYLSVMQNSFQFDNIPPTQFSQPTTQPVRYEDPQMMQVLVDGEIDNSSNNTNIIGKGIAFDVRGHGSTGNSKKEKKEQKRESKRNINNNNNYNNNQDKNHEETHNNNHHHNHRQHQGNQEKKGTNGNQKSSCCRNRGCSRCRKSSSIRSRFYWQQQQQQQQQQLQQQSQQQQRNLIEEENEEEFIESIQKQASLSQKIMLSFLLLEGDISKAAGDRAKNFLSKMNVQKEYYGYIYSMVEETYRIILLPDNILRQLAGVLNQDQLRLQGEIALNKLNLKHNKHPFAGKAAEKVRKYFRV